LTSVINRLVGNSSLREDDDELPPPPNTRHTNCLAFSNTPDVLDKTLRKMKSFYLNF